MNNPQGESIHFWHTAPLAGVELLSARYIEHRFAPHVHDGYVIGMIMAGAQRYRYRGAEQEFADQSHLSRQFKQVYGVGPGAYRSARLS